MEQTKKKVSTMRWRIEPLLFQVKTLVSNGTRPNCASDQNKVKKKTEGKGVIYYSS